MEKQKAISEWSWAVFFTGALIATLLWLSVELLYGPVLVLWLLVAVGFTIASGIGLWESYVCITQTQKEE